jgi:hypothetical protein
MSNSTRTDTLVMQAIRIIKKSMDRQKSATIILKKPAGL